MRVTFSCSAGFTLSTPKMMKAVLDFLVSLAASWQHSNVTIEDGDDYISCGLFFVDIPILFTFRDNILKVTVDSTMTGPGYHASTISMLESMAETLGFSWDEQSAEDVTGYWRHRDFKRLQQYMTDWLMDYSKTLTGDPYLQTPVRTNPIMPYTILPSGAWYFACHILGYMHKDFFLYIAEIPNPELFSRSFFVWWEVEQDAEFYLKCALSIIWCRLNWLTPILDSEMLDVSETLLLLETAWQLDKTLQLPVPEWIELAKLNDDKELANELISRFPTEINQPPNKGYLRYDIIHSLGGGKWQIKMPGMMHTNFDDDGSLIFWDHDERNIRITISTRRDSKGNITPAFELLSQAMEGMDVSPHLLPGFSNIPAFISHSSVKENGEDVFKTTLLAAMDGSVAMVSIYYMDLEEKQWALSVCDSLMPTR